MSDGRRHIPLRGGSNFRDLGGYRTRDGRVVRWGRIFRSGALWKLAEEDWRWIGEQSVGAVCDLRSREERELSPTRWYGGGRTRHIGEPYDASLLFGRRGADLVAGIGELDAGLYPLFPQLLREPLRALFAALLADELPVIIHCSAGQDRTGFACGLILAALDVPRETLVEDYLLSTACRRPENEVDQAAIFACAEENIVARFYREAIDRRGEQVLRPRSLLNKAGVPFLAAAFDFIEREWGSVEAYLEDQLEVTPAAIERLRASLLVQG